MFVREAAVDPDIRRDTGEEPTVEVLCQDVDIREVRQASMAPFSVRPEFEECMPYN